MKYDAIVIGAGPNGLTAAATLAKAGRRVLVMESADEIGGHTRALEFHPGFRAPLSDDCGWVPPSVAKSLGLDVRNETRSISMSVAASDELFSLLTDTASTANRIRRYSEKDAARWPAFVERLHKFATILGELYQLTPPDIDTRSVREVLPLIAVGRKLRGLGRNDMTEFLRVMPMSVQDLLDDTFENDLLKAAVASCAVRDLQQGPRSGGTTYNLLHYMVGAPRGSVRSRPRWVDGPDAFATTVAGVARGAGVEIRTGTRVECVNVQEGAVSGVVLGSGEEVQARTVISTADPKRTLLGMLDPVWLDPEFMLAVKNVKLRGCTAYVLYAMKGELNDPSGAFGSLVSLSTSTAALEQAADAAKYAELSTPLHVEFFAPATQWRQLAPAGNHIIVARAQYAPYRLKGNWHADRKRDVEREVTSAIARVIPGLASSVLQATVLSPPDVEERFGVTEGALTQGELTLDQILFMRPVPSWGHYAMPVDGLYLGGAGAHPGPGVLGGAGYLAARSALAANSGS